MMVVYNQKGGQIGDAHSGNDTQYSVKVKPSTKQ
jgi:hypothetical protein